MGPILICGAILIIFVSNLKNHVDQSGEESKLLLQFWLSLPYNTYVWVLINISAVVIQRISEECKRLLMLKIYNLDEKFLL